MKRIATFEAFAAIPGGRADRKSLEEIADDHGVPLTELMKQLEVGIAVEAEHTPDPEVAQEIAMDHIAEDPEYYTKLVKSGVVDEPKALKAYRDLFEGDWWDNDPNAPWNREDREPEESMGIQYSPDQQAFKVLHHVDWLAVLEAKGSTTPKGYWVVALDDLGDKDEYKLRLDYGDDVEYEVTSDSVANYATDLYHDQTQTKTSADFVDGETFLAPLDSTEIVDDVIDSLENSLAPGYSTFNPSSANRAKKEQIRKAIFFLEGIRSRL